jgi:high-affinity Fe2+/Pb2+ permease
MRIILIAISIVGLILTILPAFLVFANKIDLQLNKTLMLIGTILWFIAAPIWMREKKKS